MNAEGKVAGRKVLGKDDEIKLLYDYGLYIPTRAIIVESVEVSQEYGESGVDAHMWSRLEKALTILEKDGPDPITIAMNNPGGDDYHMLAMYDRVRLSPCHITMMASGYVMSAGSIIFQAADVRRMSPLSTMMIHHGEAGYVGHTKNFQSWATESARVENVMYDIYLGRIRQKHPDFGLERLKGMMNFDRWIPAREAVELGLADDVKEYPTQTPPSQ